MRVDTNTLEQIKTMAMEGRSRKQIASKTDLSEGVVKWQMDKNGIPLQSSTMGIKKKRKVISEMEDYSSLDDSVLFDHKQFPSV